MRLGTLMALGLLLGACASELVAATPDGGTRPRRDGSASNPCPDGQHVSGGTCVADDIPCAAEFPCPSGLQCVGGVCAVVPVPCSPDLSGPPFAAHQVLHLEQAWSALGSALLDILQKARDGILGCPPGSSADCFLFEIMASFIPLWAQVLIVVVADFGDVVDDRFLVDSVMRFVKNGRPSGYDGTDEWKRLSFTYRNMQISGAPQDLPQIGGPVVIPFQASAVCSVLHVDEHKVQGVLSGILRWVLDSVVEVASCQNPGDPCFSSLSQAIDSAIDCSRMPDPSTRLACDSFKQGLTGLIDAVIDAWLLRYSLMTLEGTAKIASGGDALTSGHWDGTLGDGVSLFQSFTGEWSAMR